MFLAIALIFTVKLHKLNLRLKGVHGMLNPHLERER